MDFQEAKKKIEDPNTGLVQAAKIATCQIRQVLPLVPKNELSPLKAVEAVEAWINIPRTNKPPALVASLERRAAGELQKHIDTLWESPFDPWSAPWAETWHPVWAAAWTLAWAAATRSKHEFYNAVRYAAETASDGP
jgi:hypothetical protein